MTRWQAGLDYTISKPVDNATIRVISLGAGVQSSVMALLAARGEIGPMPDAAIFADTQWEPAEVYEHLDWLETQLPFPVYRVTAGNIRDGIMESTNSTGQRFASVPWYIPGGIGKRQCTSEYKIQPIEREVRRLLGFGKGERITGVIAEQWIGISTDEIQRMKDARVKWIQHRWPLIELRWNRTKCYAWFQENYPGRKLPKSACLGCPFHSDRYWVELKQNSPEEWSDVVEVDKALRSNGPLRGMKQEQYMHRSCIPLENVDFRQWEHQTDFGFLEECEGMCGV